MYVRTSVNPIFVSAAASSFMGRGRMPPPTPRSNAIQVLMVTSVALTVDSGQLAVDGQRNRLVSDGKRSTDNRQRLKSVDHWRLTVDGQRCRSVSDSQRSTVN